LIAARLDSVGSDGFATSDLLGGSAAGKPVSCSWGVMGGCTAFAFKLMIDIPQNVLRDVSHGTYSKVPAHEVLIIRLPQTTNKLVF
jgi:hypothetical protein